MGEESNEVTLFDPHSRGGMGESTLAEEWQPGSRPTSGALSEDTQETLIFRRADCQRAHRWHGLGAEQVRPAWVTAEALDTAGVPAGMSQHPLRKQRRCYRLIPWRAGRTPGRRSRTFSPSQPLAGPVLSFPPRPQFLTCYMRRMKTLSSTVTEMGNFQSHPIMASFVIASYALELPELWPRSSLPLSQQSCRQGPGTRRG